MYSFVKGSYVSAGKPLFKIDEHPFREALKKAVASLHAAEAAQNSAHQLDENEVVQSEQAPASKKE